MVDERGTQPSTLASVYAAAVHPVCEGVQVNTAPKLVLLDVGMVAELTPEDQQNLVGFFKVCVHAPLFYCGHCGMSQNHSQQFLQKPQ